MMKQALFTVLLMVATLAPAIGQDQTTRNEALFEAARTGDTARIAAALDAGAQVNGKARYEMTALMFAAGAGHLDAVKLLVARGADVNVQDTFYRFRPPELALSNGHTAVAVFIIQNGLKGADGFLNAGVQAGDLDLVRAAAGADVSRESLEGALSLAERLKREPMVAVLKAALDARPAPTAPPFTPNTTTFPRYAGVYRDAASGVTFTVTEQQGRLSGQMPGQPALPLDPIAEHVFRAPQVNATVTFDAGTGPAQSLILVQGPNKLTLVRGAAAAPTAAPTATTPAAPVAPARVAASKPAGPRNWPAFRGDAGEGNGDGQRAVTEWDVATGKNIKWKTPIPGIANSSPIVWGNRVFVTTAVSASDKTFRTGLYGDVAPLNDLSEHEWKMYALDKATGKVLWERSVYKGAPKTKRHPKATQANSTPVTNGSQVVALFGSIGQLVAWDVDGRERWRVDLGVLDSGWFLDPGVQWGHSSSPIIYGNSVIVQADIQKGSYLAAWDIATGKPLWKSVRDEIPSWGTPAIVRNPNGRDEIVTNGTRIYGYDAATGRQLWTLGPNSELTVGTPVTGHGLVYVTGGYPPVRPIYAVRPGATGDLSLPKGAESSAAIAWSNMTEGTYIPTPIVYGGYLITFNINGIVTAYNAETGARAFRGRVGTGGAFAASPIAADGRLYIASEDGEVFVVTVGPGLEQVAKNDMKEVIMATPAISDGLIVIRTMGNVYGIGQ